MEPSKGKGEEHDGGKVTGRGWGKPGGKGFGKGQGKGVYGVQDQQWPDADWNSLRVWPQTQAARAAPLGLPQQCPWMSAAVSAPPSDP